MHSEVVHSEEKGSYHLIWKCNLPYKEIGVLWVLCKVSAKARDGKGGRGRGGRGVGRRGLRGKGRGGEREGKGGRGKEGEKKGEEREREGWRRRKEGTWCSLKQQSCVLFPVLGSFTLFFCLLQTIASMSIETVTWIMSRTLLLGTSDFILTWVCMFGVHHYNILTYSKITQVLGRTFTHKWPSLTTC